MVYFFLSCIILHMVIQTLAVKYPAEVEKFFIDVLGFEREPLENFSYRESFALKFKKAKAQTATLAFKFGFTKDELIELKRNVEFFNFRIAPPFKIKILDENIDNNLNILIGENLHLNILTD